MQFVTKQCANALSEETWAQQNGSLTQAILCSTAGTGAADFLNTVANTHWGKTPVSLQPNATYLHWSPPGEMIKALLCRRSPSMPQTNLIYMLS